MATAQPFENTFDVGELQGKYIKELLEQTTYSYYYHRLYASVSLLQVSGGYCNTKNSNEPVQTLEVLHYLL